MNTSEQEKSGGLRESNNPQVRSGKLSISRNDPAHRGWGNRTPLYFNRRPYKIVSVDDFEKFDWKGADSVRITFCDSFKCRDFGKAYEPLGLAESELQNVMTEVNVRTRFCVGGCGYKDQANSSVKQSISIEITDPDDPNIYREYLLVDVDEDQVKRVFAKVRCLQTPTCKP